MQPSSKDEHCEVRLWYRDEPLKWGVERASRLMQGQNDRVVECWHILSLSL